MVSAVVSADPNAQWPKMERREDSFEQWKAHVDRRLDDQDDERKEDRKLLIEIRDKLGAAKFGATAVAWLSVVGAAVVSIWVAYHGK